MKAENQKANFNNEETIALVRELLTKAESEKATNLKSAVDTLAIAKQYIPNLKIEDSGGSANNASVSSGDLEIHYHSRLGNILYAIGDYQEALSCSIFLKKALPSNYEVLKSHADCLRKLGNYEEALSAYEEAYDKIKNSRGVDLTKLSGILNNKGLTLSKMGRYKEAIESFDQAIKLCKKTPNPLYLCNKAGALLSLDEKDEAVELFREAKKLVDSGYRESLTDNNIWFIKTNTEPFIKEIEELDKIKLKKKDDFLSKRQNTVVSKFGELAGEDGPNDILEQMKKLKSAKEKVNYLQNKTPDLYEYYDGFLFGLSQSCSTAVIVNKGVFSIDSGTSTVTTLISFIPFVGDKIAAGIEAVSSFIKDVKVTSAASNICKLFTLSRDFDDLAQDLTLDLVIRNEKELQTNVNNILNKYTAKYSGILGKLKLGKDEIEKSLYGERNETVMQKFGYKMSNDLMENYIANGEIYKNEKGEPIPAIRIKPEEKKDKLLNFSQKLIQEELKSKDDTVKEVKESASNKIVAEQNLQTIKEGKKTKYIDPKTNQTIKEEESYLGCGKKTTHFNEKDKNGNNKVETKCTIFKVQTIYDNQLLNPENKHLFDALVSEYGIVDAINMGEIFGRDDVL